ncbi:unnamed protein product [Microthlaspi erraticum]|uniref:Uncharacterized protein n=1 Tax=Microthlaspi erraticum TaxID=1685480 RepID=A0A6D2J2K8_9BRAS|nr:unnamed protein product [Microthlaspi erraticum]
MPLVSYLLLSAKPYSQAKDLKQALHGRQPMRIEGEKGVKTQSAPKHWPRTRKSNFGRAILIWPTVTVEPGRNSSCSAGFTPLRDRTVRAHDCTEGTARSAEIFVSERTDRAGRSGKQTIGLGRNSLAKTNLADQIARPRQNPSAIGPKLF